MSQADFASAETADLEELECNNVPFGDEGARAGGVRRRVARLHLSSEFAPWPGPQVTGGRALTAEPSLHAGARRAFMLR